ncbi:MAG: hypothetical protein ACR2QF_02215, partial [Geminicoccaceae bacterium]
SVHRVAPARNGGRHWPGYIKAMELLHALLDIAVLEISSGIELVPASGRSQPETVLTEDVRYKART